MTGVLIIYHVKRTRWAALQQERFDLPSLTPALRNLRLVPLKLMSQQLPGNISFVRDRLNVAQQGFFCTALPRLLDWLGQTSARQMASLNIVSNGRILVTYQF